MRMFVRTTLVLFCCFFLAGCSLASNGGGSSTLNIILKTTTSSLFSSTRAGTACSVTYESTTDNGNCYTPLQIKGVFTSATLGSTGGGAGVRILGGGSLVGLDAVFQRANFDLTTPPTISGDDNIQDGSGGPYNYVALNIAALEYAFLAEATDVVYRVRIPFAATPPSSSTVYSSCGLGGGLDEADTKGTLYTSITAEAGDILVCIKSTQTETCADSDYNWVTTGGALAATRPGTPKKISGTHLMTADSCTPGSTPDITWGYASMNVSLATAVSVSATTGSSKRYTSGGSTGSTLTFTLDISTAGAIFVPTTSLAFDLNAANQAQILGAIEKILPKPIYVNSLKSTAASSSDAMLSASATLAIQ